MSIYAATRTIGAIALGATAGALCRYGLNGWIMNLAGPSFPLGIMIVNISGCFVMGFVVTLPALQRLFGHYPGLRLVITTGFLGSYTTFSSYELDTGKLLGQNPGLSLLYWAGTPLLGMLGLQLGMMLATLGKGVRE